MPDSGNFPPNSVVHSFPGQKYISIHMLRPICLGALPCQILLVNKYLLQFLPPFVRFNISLKVILVTDLEFGVSIC